jgi:outer membrane receptor protein involved in Fe transport
MNVRGSYSETVSRPEFRELAPTLIPAQRGERPRAGNPFLEESHITNYDLRWEWFFAPAELVSFGLFYKTIDKPVEPVVLTIGSDLLDTFQNAEEATLKGFEFEARKNLGFLTPHLRGLGFAMNVAYVDSNVTGIGTGRQPFIQGGGSTLVTSKERQLVGQSPFVINSAVEYTHSTWGTYRLLYNTAGPRIETAGVTGLPDIFEERRDQLDAVAIFPLSPWGWPFTLKLAAENILNDDYVTTQGSAIQERHLTGTKFTFGVSYSF